MNDQLLFDAEGSVVGAIILDDTSWERISSFGLRPEFFKGREHGILFSELSIMHGEGESPDIITLAERLMKKGLLDDVGGLRFIGDIISSTPTAANVAGYAKIVHEAYILRRVNDYGRDVIRCANSHDDERGDIIGYAERGLDEIASIGGQKDLKLNHVKHFLNQAVEDIELAYEEQGGITGLATPYCEFNELTAGLQSKDLIIIAGRPGMGKTSFAMNLAQHIALDLEKTVAVFSLEMPGEQLALRMTASVGMVKYSRMRSGMLEDEDWPRITSGLTRIAASSIYIDESANNTVQSIRSAVKSLKQRIGRVDAIIIDYLQLISTESKSYGHGKNNDIAEISRGLKKLAIELDTPVIALSQLNRSLEQRADKRPIMSDLKESGAIEQDADMIVFIYRDDVYFPDSPDKGTAEIIIGKQRNGPLGMVRLVFEGDYNRFVDYNARQSDFG